MDGELATPDARKERTLQRRRRLEGRLAEAALGRFGLGGATVEPLRLGEGFTQVLRVSAGRGERFALKLYSPPPPPDGASAAAAVDAGELRTAALLRSPEVLASQLGWLSDLGRQTDLLVPEPVPLPDGSLMGSVSVHNLTLRGAPGMSRNFCLLRWVPGEHKRDQDLTARDISLVGSYLARLHRYAEAYGIPEGAALPRWDWSWAFGPSAPLWSKGEAFYSEGEMEVFRTVAGHVREDLERLGEGPEVFGIVHRDPKLENLLFGGSRVGAVDFDLAGMGHYTLDLRVVRASLEHHHPDRLETLWAAFLKGYEQERPLHEDHGRYLKTFTVMQRVSAVNRRLDLLGSGGKRGILKNTVPWLEGLNQRW